MRPESDWRSSETKDGDVFIFVARRAQRLRILLEQTFQIGQRQHELRQLRFEVLMQYYVLHVTVPHLRNVVHINEVSEVASRLGGCQTEHLVNISVSKNIAVRQSKWEGHVRRIANQHRSPMKMLVII